MPPGREAVAWGDVVAILTIGRLCEPSSELHVAEDWYRSTALEDLLGVEVERIYDERLYRALDRVVRTRRRWRSTWSNGSGSCSPSSTTSCFTM